VVSKQCLRAPFLLHHASLQQAPWACWAARQITAWQPISTAPSPHPGTALCLLLVS
jgi:hypothetical protein